MIQSLLEIALCLLVFFCLYKVVLESTSLHRFKRFYLLFCLLFSLVIPFLAIEIPSQNPIVASTAIITSTVYEAIVGPEVKELSAIAAGSDKTIAEQPTNYGWFIGMGYFIVTLILVIRFTRNIHRLISKALSSTRIPYGEAEVTLINERIIPHNFLKYIFINTDDYKNEEIGEQLLAHELGHAKQKHSFDILLIEFLQVIFWFNPLYYFYGKAIRLNHEYLADSIVLKTHSNVAQYQLLLLQFATKKQGSELNLACLSNYSLTKKRFKMMTQQTSKIAAMVRVAILLPLLVVTILAFGINTQASELIDSSTNGFIDTIESTIFQENKPELHPLGNFKFSHTSATFGMRKDPVTKEDKTHKGVDFSAKTGTLVIATASGTVEKVESLKTGYGKYIQIKHDGQYQTLYAQLNEINVEVGDKVEKGQLIGKVGSTGHSTGPHLHYEVIKDGKRVDPRDYYKAIPEFRPVIIEDGKAKDPKDKVLYELKEPRGVNFGNGYKYEGVIYDDNKVVFLRKNEQPIIKKMDDLSAEQVEALKSLTLPFPPFRGRLELTQEIVDNWSDPTIYGIWIDNKKVDNSVMSNYKASDFATYFKSFLYPNAKKGKIYTYQLDLTTHERYEKDKTRAAEQKAEWEKTTKTSLAMLDF
ncbi:MAG: beta-lactamase regulating signal transducer with metallopeptidase domain [Roseivirga sp.]|jgi:beta-lactamase regulating signal transducer with metallopeptidase domain